MDLTGEYHSLCEHCGDLLISPIPVKDIVCAGGAGNVPAPCGHFNQNVEWRWWPDPSEPDWAGCA